MEKYIIINGFDNYAISNYGNVKNIKNGRLLKLQVSKNGYYNYSLCQNGIKKNLMVHRLVALYFIENPDNKPYVNHKDGNKLNNHYTNLEWVTAKENDTHARTTGLKNQNKPIIAKHIITNEEMVFSSISESSAILCINKGSIARVLSGKRKKCHNYNFKYL